MAKRKNKTTTPKGRNVIAVAAITRSGAGRHPDRKKMNNKRACRGKVREW
jgi:hypothetical protein